MPHLPPFEGDGGSFTIAFPIERVNAKGKVVQTLLKKKEVVTKAYRKGDDQRFVLEKDQETYPKGVQRYNIQSYSAVDTKAQIYLVEIYGADKSEKFEFRPKDGKCHVKLYYALEDELPVSRKDKWEERKGRRPKK